MVLASSFKHPSQQSERTLSFSRGSMSIGQTEIHVKGKPVKVPSAQIEGTTVLASGTWLKTAMVQDEELTLSDSVVDPESFVSQLKKSGLAADIVTFSQKLW